MITIMLDTQSSSDSAGSEIYYAVVIVLFFYFLPTIIGAIRKVPNAASVFVINFFLGWTFIGWVAALAMAARTAPPLS